MKEGNEAHYSPYSEFSSLDDNASFSPVLLAIGIDGMLGSALARAAEHCPMPFVGTSRRPGSRWFLDLSAPPESWHLPDNASSAILCAGETSIAACEANPESTAAINITATIALSNRLADQGTSLVFISSSRVFAPCVEFPDESTAPRPATEYGRQKLAVENHLLRHHPSTKIIRLAKIVSPALLLFSSWRQALANGASVQAYSDLFLSAVSLRAAADAILRIALGSTPGIFHISASDAISYFDVARFLANIEGVANSLVHSSLSLQPNTPNSAVLSCRRTIENTTFRPATSLENLRTAFEYTLS